MNINKLSLALLCAFASLPAMAQSSNVTMYGRVDLGLARNLGSDVTELRQGSGSRLGFRGAEDLGGGLKVIFNIEHRFSADTGVAAGNFWDGRSVVGLQGGFGTVVLGRDYTPARNVANKLDPWGGDTIAAHESNIRGFAPSRKNNAITYTSPSMSGFKLEAQLELEEDTKTDTKQTYGFAATYAAGPLSLGFGYDKFAKTNSTWYVLSGGYDFGVAKVMAGFGSGENAAGVEHRSYLIGATAPIGTGELRAAWSKRKIRLSKTDEPIKTDLSSKFSVGYFHPLSKRTTVYVDIGNDSELSDNKTGFDIGLRHNF